VTVAIAFVCRPSLALEDAYGLFSELYYVTRYNSRFPLDYIPFDLYLFPFGYLIPLGPFFLFLRDAIGIRI
jgi:hypothetical protein